MTPAQFRIDFPEFADAGAYPDALLQQWLTVAASLVNAARWGALLNFGTELCAAHYLILALRDQAAAAAGNLPGAVGGLQTSKAVGDLSVSYDVASVVLADAPFWNQTTYGIRFAQLARLMGAGPMQVWSGTCTSSEAPWLGLYS